MNATARDRMGIAGALALVAIVHAVLLYRNTPTTYRYDELARAFLRGQTHRVEPPAPELLALDTPFDAAKNQRWREHDLVLFNGHFYYYWGPAPAVLIAPIKLLVSDVRVSDALLAWIFAQILMLGIAKTQAAVRRRWFPAGGVAPVVACVFATGLATPMPFLFARPSIYEAAILGGQCFLILAAWFAITSKRDARVSGWRLLLAGVFGSLAIASRLNLAPAVAVLALLALWHVQRTQPRSVVTLVRSALLLAMPLVLTVSLLAAYNHARFGSISESGIHFMLASRPGRTALERGQAFSVRYVAANLLNYTVAPVKLQASPPFVCPARGVAMEHPPRYYRTDIVAGIISAAPFFLLAVVPVVRSMRGLTRSRGAWVSAVLSLMAAAALVTPVLMFFYCSIRYLTDITPALATFAAGSLWQIKSSRYHALATAMLAWSCIVGVLLAVTGYAAT